MGKFLVLLVLAVAALIWLTHEKPPQPAPLTNPSPENADREFSEPFTFQQTPRPTRASTRPMPPSAPRGAASSQEPRVRAAARQARVTIKSYRQTGMEARVQVEWTGAVATYGGDFVDVLRRQGIIRDFDTLGMNAGVDRQGRRVHSYSVLLKLNP